jgi:predicted NBD/HSP70 family sugar kinase
MTSLGIDIGGRSVKVAAREGGRWLWTGQSAPYDRPDATALTTAVRSAVAGRLERVDRVGLCVPGLLDAGGTVVTTSVNLPGLAGLPLKGFVADALGARPAPPIRTCGDAAATAHDLYVSRQLTGRLFVLAIGTGVGAAVLDDGAAPLQVDGDSPGHFGQLDVSVPGHDVTGPDGGAGSLEGYLGGPALARAYGPNVSTALEQFTGDEPAVAALARALRLAHALYRPQHVILAGGTGMRLAHLLPAIRERVAHRLTRIARYGWTFGAADNEFCAARGAARLASAACR